MSDKPVILLQKADVADGAVGEELIIHAIAVYAGAAPETLTIQRAFDGEESFKFPTQINFGTTRTRLVYSYTIQQWKELLASVTAPPAPGSLRQIMIPVLIFLQGAYPDHFQDIEYDPAFSPEQYAETVLLEAPVNNN